MKLIKKILIATSTTGAAIFPLIMLVSCKNKNDNKDPTIYKNGEVKGRKVVSQTFEPIDFLSTFKLKPNFYTGRSDVGVYMDAMPQYLKQTFSQGQLDDVEKIDTQIYNWSKKQLFNPSKMLKKLNDKKGVLLTNLFIHKADEVIKQAFNGVIYDDLGNDSGIGSYPGTIKLGDNYTQPRMYDVVKNYKAFTKGLDKLYGTKYINQAKTNATKFSAYVKDFKTKNIGVLKNKTILFVKPNERVTNQATANNIAIWAPLAYNLFYADQTHNGLGMKFPKPKTWSWPKAKSDGGLFTPWVINNRNSNTANNSTKLVEEYEGRADYVVYLTNTIAWDNVNAKSWIEDAKQSNVAKLLKPNVNVENNIILADYSTFYRGMYGIIGQQEALKKMAINSEWQDAFGSNVLKPADSQNEILNASATLTKLSELK